MEFEIPSWGDIEAYTLEIAKKLYPNKNKFDAIICIWRGGACLSRLLSDYLNIKTILNITVQYYDDIQKPKESPIIFQSIAADLKGKNVLVCDDISDSGITLSTVYHYLLEQNCASITTVTLYIKPETKFIPDYYAKNVPSWVVFPWECIETLESLIKKFSKEGKSLEAIKKELLSVGFEQKQIEAYLSIRKNQSHEN